MSKCIIILSNKSSGSSACQRLMANFSDINTVEKTRHYQNETLYWTKAASILGKPQINMLDSEVPIDAAKALKDLQKLLSDNLGSVELPSEKRDLIFQGWDLLCEKYRPIFLEKSPHHLCQWSALELIMECMESLPHIEFCIVGLIRNPMDVLYSAFRRWKIKPEKYQYEWLTAYKNLLKLKEMLGDKVVLLRYEDMVRSVNYLRPVLEFADVNIANISNDYLHTKSISRWKKDKWYGFQLDSEVEQLAKSFGYQEDELQNDTYPSWFLYENLQRTFYKAGKPARQLATILKTYLQKRCG